MFAHYQKDKNQQREAVENCFGNFVEPMLKIQLQPQPIAFSSPQIISPSLAIALLLWFLCLGIHIRQLCQKNQ